MSICPSSGPRPASPPHPTPPQTAGFTFTFPAPHLRGEHGDVVELSTPPLFDRHRQEESAGVFGEHRFLVLEDAQKQKVKIPHTRAAQTVFYSKPFRR